MNKFLLVLAGVVLSANAVAQQNDRDGMWEIGVLFNNISSESLSGDNGSFIDTDSANGYGLTVGFNFSSHLALSGEYFWSTPDYDASLVSDDGQGTVVDISHELSLSTFMLKGTFNFLDRPATPFVEAGFGWTHIDSNIQNAPPITGCWWDPWWGYICDTFYSTFSKTQESYSAAVGFRFDTRNGWSLKGSYGIQEINTSKATEDASLEVIRLDVAWLF